MGTKYLIKKKEILRIAVLPWNNRIHISDTANPNIIRYIYLKPTTSKVCIPSEY